MSLANPKNGIIKTAAAFQLKGGLFTLTVLQLLQTDMDAIEQQLQTIVQQNPKFFQNAPVIIDLQRITSKNANIDFKQLAAMLKHYGLILVGIRNAHEKQVKAAMEEGLAILSDQPNEMENVKTRPALPGASKIISHPVRSGQQIYAKDTDLVILSSVSPGAELLADGHIHVYGALRGRALAGINGDKNAHIFCRTLEAELVSIAGYYWVSEDLKAMPEPQGSYIYLENEQLRMGSF